MKKLVSLALALLLALTAMVFPAMAQAPFIKFGMLSMLNMSEEEAAELVKAQTRVAIQIKNIDANAQNPAGSGNVIFYDSLDAMLMALNAGEISLMGIYETTARYLIQNNPQLIMSFDYENVNRSDFLADSLYRNVLSNDFAFMFLERNEALRDEFNAALAAITDEEKARLIQEHIDTPCQTGEITPVEMPIFEGAETIKVAVTGALPPLDYVAPDGKPAGFNTALLSEISKQLEKNIELVQVDSMGRAAALASGTVDAVFWTRTNSEANRRGQMSEEERQKEFETEIKPQLSEEEFSFTEALFKTFDEVKYGQADMPEGTIITDPYYSDVTVSVMTRSTAEAVGRQ